MSKLLYEGEEQYRPLTAWGYVGYTLLFSIPLVGLVLIIVFALSDNNINRRNYARSYLCWMLIAVILIIFAVATGSIPVIESAIRRSAYGFR